MIARPTIRVTYVQRDVASFYMRYGKQWDEAVRLCQVSSFPKLPPTRIPPHKSPLHRHIHVARTNVDSMWNVRVLVASTCGLRLSAHGFATTRKQIRVDVRLSASLPSSSNYVVSPHFQTTYCLTFLRFDPWTEERRPVRCPVHLPVQRFRFDRDGFPFEKEISLGWTRMGDLSETSSIVRHKRHRDARHGASKELDRDHAHVQEREDAPCDG